MIARSGRRRFVLGTLAGIPSAAIACHRGPLVTEPPGPAIVREASRVRLAAIGDYGIEGEEAASVAALVRELDPDGVLTLGDNNYPAGRESTLDDNVGRYYHDFIGGYAGRHGSGADVPRFFPSLGNHDWRAPEVAPFRSYFSLPGIERYYDVRWGPVHLFALDSDDAEPDGCAVDSAQARWLQQGLAASPAPWRVVYFHHPPYSSGMHGSSEHMRWPFFEWGATIVLSGHDHNYERIETDGGVYIVNGLGGHPTRYPFRRAIPESRMRFRDDHGAMRIEASYDRLEVAFVTRDGRVIDEIAR